MSQRNVYSNTGQRKKLNIMKRNVSCWKNTWFQISWNVLLFTLKIYPKLEYNGYDNQMYITRSNGYVHSILISEKLNIPYVFIRYIVYGDIYEIRVPPPPPHQSTKVNVGSQKKLFWVSYFNQNKGYRNNFNNICSELNLRRWFSIWISDILLTIFFSHDSHEI